MDDDDEDIDEEDEEMLHELARIHDLKSGMFVRRKCVL